RGGFAELPLRRPRLFFITLSPNPKGIVEVYEKYPIAGITRSYRHVPRTRTVVMPLLIATLVVGWLTFFFKGEPPSHLTVPDISERIPNELDLGPMLSDGTADEPSERRKEMGAGQESKTAKILPPVPEGDTTEFS